MRFAVTPTLSSFLLVFALQWTLGVEAEPINYFQIAYEKPLIDALALLEETSAQNQLTFMQETGVHVIFKNLTEISPSYQGYDALSWISDTNQQFIFINQKHVQAPPQALAALISHEVMHADKVNSLAEEMAAWQKEGQTWRELKERYPHLKQVPNGKIPLMDRLNAIVLLQQHNMLNQEISGNVAYQNLPQHSPGF